MTQKAARRFVIHDGGGNHPGVRTIALEEHFWAPQLAAQPGTGTLAVWGQQIDDRLRDLGQPGPACTCCG